MAEEGVIKFHCEWKEIWLSPAPLLAGLMEYRQYLFEKQFIGLGEGGIGYGNISVRQPGNSFLISATQTGHIASATPAHYTEVYRWDIDCNRVWCRGMARASSESMTHAALYEASDAIGAVLHIHSRSLWEKYLNILPTTSQAVPYGTPQMARAIQALYHESEQHLSGVFVMGGHRDGLLAFGPNLEQAWEVLSAI